MNTELTTDNETTTEEREKATTRKSNRITDSRKNAGIHHGDHTQASPPKTDGEDKTLLNRMITESTYIPTSALPRAKRYST